MKVLDEGVTWVGQLIIWERLNRENVCVHDLLALDKSILKSPIKIISLDSRQTESIIQTNLSTQLAGSDGLRYIKPTRIGEDFISFTSNHTHSTPYSSYRVRRLKDTCSSTYTIRPVSLRASGSFLIVWKPAIDTSLSSYLPL